MISKYIVYMTPHIIHLIPEQVFFNLTRYKKFHRSVFYDLFWQVVSCQKQQEPVSTQHSISWYLFSVGFVILRESKSESSIEMKMVSIINTKYFALFGDIVNIHHLHPRWCQQSGETVSSARFMAKLSFLFIPDFIHCTTALSPGKWRKLMGLGLTVTIQRQRQV